MHTEETETFGLLPKFAACRAGGVVDMFLTEAVVCAPFNAGTFPDRKASIAYTRCSNVRYEHTSASGLTHIWVRDVLNPVAHRLIYL